MDYRKLYEKRARTERFRGYAAIAGGIVNIVAGLAILRQLRDEQK